MQQELTAAGVDPFEERVYRALLTRGTATPAELADMVGSTSRRVTGALDRLREQGLVGRLSGGRRRYAAVEPRAAVEALIRARTTELDRVRSAADELSRLFAAAGQQDAEEVEIVTGSEALGHWFVRLQQEAQDEVLTLDRPPYALTASNPVQSTGLRRGLRYRTVYAPEALEWPGVLGEVQELVKQGEQARVLPGLRVKLAIADRRLALLPLSLDLSRVRALVVRPSALLDALLDFSESCWAQATPIGSGSPADDDPLGEEDRTVLTLLAAGLKDEAIARQLGWSVRTMRRRISRLHQLLGADNRFQAGLAAARRGWL